MVGFTSWIIFVGVAVHLVAASSASNTSACVGEECLTLSCSDEEVYELETSLLQTSVRQTPNFNPRDLPLFNTGPSPYNPLAPDRLWILELTATFISNNGLLCVEGLIKPTIGALALKKAGLHGALYNETQARSETNCASQGYSLNAGADPTYVGMTVFFRSAAEQTAFAEAEDAALEAYRAQYSLPQDLDLVLMSKCTAHLESPVGLSVKGQCDPVNEFYGSYNHHSFYDPYQELICNSAPFQFVVFSFALIKSTSQAHQHIYDQIIPGDCNSRGYESENTGGLTCFSQQPAWELECHWKAAQGDFLTLDAWMGPPLAAHCNELGMDDYVCEVMSIAGCTCLPGTVKMRENEPQGVCTNPNDTSDIRVWWHGQN